jgi:hypothetical protein
VVAHIRRCNGCRDSRAQPTRAISRSGTCHGIPLGASPCWRSWSSGRSRNNVSAMEYNRCRSILTPVCYHRLQNDILHLFGKYKSWAAIPKFLHMRKYAEDIRRYGMTDLTTTGPKESYNKTLRAAWQFTNKKTSTLQEQVRPLPCSCEARGCCLTLHFLLHSTGCW